MVGIDEVIDIMDRPASTVERLVNALITEGLIRREGNQLML
jgi:predicted transcriptional regulator